MLIVMNIRSGSKNTCTLQIPASLTITASTVCYVSSDTNEEE